MDVAKESERRMLKFQFHGFFHLPDFCDETLTSGHELYFQFEQKCISSKETIFQIGKSINIDKMQQEPGVGNIVVDEISENGRLIQMFAKLITEEKVIENSLNSNVITHSNNIARSDSEFDSILNALSKMQEENNLLNASLEEFKVSADKEIKAKEEALMAARETFLCLHMASDVEIDCVRAELFDCEKQLEHTLKSKEDEVAALSSNYAALQTEKDLLWDSLNTKQGELDSALKEIQARRDLHAAQSAKIFDLEKNIAVSTEHIIKLMKDLSENNDKLQAQKAEINSLQTELENVNIELKSLTSEEVDLKEELKEIYQIASTEKEKSYNLGNEISRLNSNISTVEQECKDCRKDLAEAEAEIVSLQTQLSKFRRTGKF